MHCGRHSLMDAHTHSHQHWDVYLKKSRHFHKLNIKLLRAVEQSGGLCVCVLVLVVYEDVTWVRCWYYNVKVIYEDISCVLVIRNP